MTTTANVTSPVTSNSAFTTGSTGTTASTTTGSDSALSNVDFTTYITLLTKQLQNQDPTQPMDSNQFTQQIAVYAQLEQQIKGNDLLTTISQSKDYTQQAVASSYLGKQVLSPGTSVGFDGSNSVSFGYNLPTAASSAQLQIYDSSGQEVMTQTVDTTEGLHQLTWDGTETDGSTAPAGKYTVAVAAYDSTGTKLTATPETYQVAQEMVTNPDGTIDFKLQDGSVAAFTDISDVRLDQSAAN